MRNITDIDDKIIKRAAENNETVEALVTRFTKAMHDDAKGLNTAFPTLEPRATEYIPLMIKMIQTLMDKGFAYAGSNGDVFYEVHKFNHYGCLSHRNLERSRIWQ